MFSFQAISDNNGWAMAFAGALIVMSGLSILSFIIAQLHRIVAVFEKKASATEAVSRDKIPEKFPDSIDQVAALYEPLVKQLPETFSLDALYALTRENKYPHPHLTIRAFRAAGILKPQGEGQFSWKSTS